MNPNSTAPWMALALLVLLAPRAHATSLELAGGLGDFYGPLALYGEHTADWGSWTLELNYDAATLGAFDPPPDYAAAGSVGWRPFAPGLASLIVTFEPVDPGALPPSLLPPFSVDFGGVLTIDVANDEADGSDRLRFRATRQSLPGLPAYTVPIAAGVPNHPTHTHFGLLFELIDTTGTVFSDTSAPASIDLDDFDAHRIFFGTGPEGFLRYSAFWGGTGLGGYPNSAIVPIVSIPEPRVPLAEACALATLAVLASSSGAAGRRSRHVRSR